MKKDFILLSILFISSMFVNPLAFANPLAHAYKLPETTSEKENIQNRASAEILSIKKVDKIEQLELNNEQINNRQKKALEDIKKFQQIITKNNFMDILKENTIDIDKILNKKKADDLLLNAMGLLGANYRFGGTSPINGFDCSGFLQFIFKESLNISLPRTSRAMAEFGEEVKREHLQAGDLVFFRTTRRAQITHVGMYVGNGNFIHAPRTGKSIEIQSMKKEFYKKRFVTARRVPEIIIQAKSLGTST